MNISYFVLGPGQSPISFLKKETEKPKPTREQLESALINADKAGDYNAAKQLANALKGGQFDRMDEKTGQKKKPKQKNVFDQFDKPSGKPWEKYSNWKNAKLVDIKPQCVNDDDEEWKYEKTPKGTLVRLSFCFKAYEAVNGEMLIPYKVDTKTKKWWLKGKYSSSVSDYTKLVVSKFRLPKADSDWADSQWWPARWEQIWLGAKWLAGGLFVIFLFSAITGWIVRGFMGIPMGQDRKPESNQEE